MKTIRQGIRPERTAPWLGQWECPHCGRIEELESGDRLHHLGQPTPPDISWSHEYRTADHTLFRKRYRPERIGQVICAECGRFDTWYRPDQKQRDETRTRW